ncbi:cupin domain-containing protein [Nonomuraea sp. NPDC059007]|uniref:cupin domain-containing protein n=1 Tax=Nonomuraea sp. NPDC059007 TaxID=3346692 RepID=UPI00369CC394
MTRESNPAEAVQKIALQDVTPNRRRGGDIRVLLSPKTVGSSTGFMGILTLAPGEYVSEHYHPYSEEFLYAVRGTVEARVEDKKLAVGAGEGIMIPKGLRHRVTNTGVDTAVLVFHLCPLAPRPELGHVDTEALPHPDAVGPEVGGR